MLAILVQLIPTLICVALFLIIVHLCQLISKHSKEPATRYPIPRPQTQTTTHNQYRTLPVANQRNYQQQPASPSSPKAEPKPPIITPPPKQEVKQPEPIKTRQKLPTSVPTTPQAQALRQPAKSKQPAVAVNRGAPFKVLLLLHHDQPAADRLFAKVSTMNPGKDERWCWDKVQWDLERDRH